MFVVGSAKYLVIIRRVTDVKVMFKVQYSWVNYCYLLVWQHIDREIKAGMKVCQKRHIQMNLVGEGVGHIQGCDDSIRGPADDKGQENNHQGPWTSERFGPSAPHSKVRRNWMTSSNVVTIIKQYLKAVHGADDNDSGCHWFPYLIYNTPNATVYLYNINNTCSSWKAKQITFDRREKKIWQMCF
jgi:hypothetical protein